MEWAGVAVVFVVRCLAHSAELLRGSAVKLHITASTHSVGSVVNHTYCHVLYRCIKLADINRLFLGKLCELFLKDIIDKPQSVCPETPG